MRRNKTRIASASHQKLESDIGYWLICLAIMVLFFFAIIGIMSLANTAEDFAKCEEEHSTDWCHHTLRY